MAPDMREFIILVIVTFYFYLSRAPLPKKNLLKNPKNGLNPPGDCPQGFSQDSFQILGKELFGLLLIKENAARSPFRILEDSSRLEIVSRKFYLIDLTN